MTPVPTARFVPLPARAAGGAVCVALFLATAQPAAGQTATDRDTNRIDITGRQNLTLGSGARAYGMGGAFLARADDATAASWNPAGLSYLRLPEVSIVGVHNSIDVARGLDTDSFGGEAVDFGAFTWPVGVGDVRGAVQLSYQRAISFDGARSIRQYNPASGALLVSEDGSSNGGFDVVAFGTGLRLTRRIRAGVTVNRWFNGYTQTLSRTFLKDSQRPLRDFDLDFRPQGWSFNLGLIVSPIEQLNLAAVYKTPFTADVHLDQARRDSWGTLGNITEVTSNAYASDAVRLEFPSSFGFGVSWRPHDTLTFSADYTRTRWSQTIISNYFDLPATGRSDEGVSHAPPPPTVYDPLQYPSLRAVPDPSDPQDPARLLAQQDAEQIRAGVEWVLITGSLKVPLRAGYFNDRQIIPISGGNAPRFNGVTVGTGVILGSLLLDFAYVYEFGKYFVATEAAGGGDFDLPPTPQPPVEYSLKTNRFYASIIYRFSGRWGP
jgi:long-subunit fatty acid transport protein